MDEPCKLMEVRDETEGSDICERLRVAGIKCAVEPFPDANSFAPSFGGQAPTVLIVLVNESELDNARVVIDAFESDTKEHKVLVCETRPLPGDSSPIGAGFEAICECDWSGPIRESCEEVFTDAHAHSKNVSAEIVHAAPAPDD